MSSKSDISIPLLPNCAYHVFNRGNSERPIFFEEDNYAFFLKRFQDYTEGYIDTYAYCLLENHYHFCIKLKSAKEILTKSLTEGRFSLDGNFLIRHVASYIRSISDVTGLSEEVLVEKEQDRQLILDLVDESSIHYSSDEACRALAHHILLKLERDHESLRFEEHPISMKQVPFSIKLCSYLISQRMQRFFLSYAKFINYQQKRTGSLFQKTFHRKFLATVGEIRTVVSYIHHNVIHHECGNSYEDYEWSSYRDYVSREKHAITDEKALFTVFGGVTEFVECAEAYREYKEEVDRWEKRQLNRMRLIQSMKSYPDKQVGMLTHLDQQVTTDALRIDSS